jgi:hypothetical protein
MQATSEQPVEPKKSAIKNWKSQAKRTADSNNKLKRGLDQLAPLVKRYPDEKLHRTEVPYRAAVRLQGLNDPLRSPKSILHSITAYFCEIALRPKEGERVNLTVAWEKLLRRVMLTKPDLMAKLNNEACRDAFFWQIAGYAESYPHPFRNAPVLTFLRKRGLHKGKLFHCFALEDGTLFGIPKRWQPNWPFFLCLGDRWNRKPVFDYTVANMELSWPCRDFNNALKRALWEPSKKTLERLAKRQKEKRSRRR